MFEAGKAKRLGSPASRIRFARTGSDSWKEWNRFLELDEKVAFRIGNICSTCEFLFERKEGANQSVSAEDVAEALERGIAGLADPMLDRVASILPEGAYQPLLMDVPVKLVQPLTPDDYFLAEQVELWGVDGFWDLPHDCRSFYYRAPVADLGRKAHLFEFVIPMYPPSWLETECVHQFQAAIERDEHPTAFAVSVLDVKGPATWPQDRHPAATEHYCLAHYLLDGHHKTRAAAAAGRPIRLLSFIAVEQGISSPEEIERAVKAIKRRG